MQNIYNMKLKDIKKLSRYRPQVMLHFCQQLSLNLPFIELSIPDKTIGIGQKNKMENKKKSGYVHKIIIYSVK